MTLNAMRQPRGLFAILMVWVGSWAAIPASADEEANRGAPAKDFSFKHHFGDADLPGRNIFLIWRI